MNRYFHRAVVGACAQIVGQRGVTLVELIAFIIIVGLLVSGVIGGFSTTMRGSGVPRQVTQALQLAQERMELIRARKDFVGFACFTNDVNGPRYDPCGTAAAAGSCPATIASTHPACSAATTFGYTAIPALDETGACMGGDVNYKCITVTVNDAGGARLSQLQAAVANY